MGTQPCPESQTLMPIVSSACCVVLKKSPAQGAKDGGLSSQYWGRKEGWSLVTQKAGSHMARLWGTAGTHESCHLCGACPGGKATCRASMKQTAPPPKQTSNMVSLAPSAWWAAWPSGSLRRNPQGGAGQLLQLALTPSHLRGDASLTTSFPKGSLHVLGPVPPQHIRISA